MIRRPPRSTRTDTLFPYPTLFRSGYLMIRYKVSAWIRVSRTVHLASYAMFWSPMAIAQSNSTQAAPTAFPEHDEKGETVVTARRTEEHLSDVPAWVSAFSSEQLARSEQRRAVKVRGSSCKIRW